MTEHELLQRLMTHFWEDREGHLMWQYKDEYTVFDIDPILEAAMLEYKKSRPVSRQGGSS